MTVSVAGRELSSSWFTARPSSGDTGTPAGAAEYQAAFDAFKRGDAEQAEAIFRAILQKMPAWGLAHNALGFILLARGNATAALASFREAERLQATVPDILQMNIGCCLYLMGAFADAVRNFEACLHRKVVSTPAILMVIVGDGFEQVEVVTPGDYVMLASLNAGWGALSLRDLATAQRHLNVARASLDPETTSQTFVNAMIKADEALADLEREA
jgi:tetratricopeptide (TPR) repeat protein